MLLKNISFTIKLFLFLLVLGACSETKKEPNLSLKSKVKTNVFIGSKSCKSCHENEFINWQESHHDKAMQIADSTTVLGDFNNTKFKGRNNTSTFYTKGKEYFVKTQDENGDFKEYKIVYTFGITPLQQYIVKFPNGAYQCLLTAWNTIENKWFYLQADMDLKHNEWLNWSGGSMRWNTMCADCHSTNLQKNFEPNKEEYKTTFSEINVGCESCHGPASKHVDFYKKENQTGTPPKFYLSKNENSKLLVDKCARCHSRRSQLTKAFDYTGSFSDHYRLSLPMPPNYEEDGQIKNEDYVYGSFIQSKMYHNGVSCIDCHNAHSLKLKKEGNALCVSCHKDGYEDPKHHFHEQKSKGAQCINCHMPGKTYMGNDFRRDHSFRIPRPDQSIKYGTPNACNRCHSNKSAKWASEVINAKFGNNRKEHFSDSLLAGYHGNNSAMKYVMKNSDYPNVIRAAALRSYGSRKLTKTELKKIFVFLKDSSSLVRNEALEILNVNGNKSGVNLVEPLLLDSVRLVRVSAASYFNTVGYKPKIKYRSVFKIANKELLEQHNMSADFSSGQHQIALYYQNLGNIELAIIHYKKAIEIDGYANVSRMNLALLYYNKGAIKSAEKMYLKVIETEKDYAYSYYMLALLYNEIGEKEKSLHYFSEACTKTPVIIRAFYNYALKLQEGKEYEKSKKIIDKALKTSPNNENLLYIKLIAQLNLKERLEAKKTCNILLSISPQNTNYRQIMSEL